MKLTKLDIVKRMRVGLHQARKSSNFRCSFIEIERKAKKAVDGRGSVKINTSSDVSWTSVDLTNGLFSSFHQFEHQTHRPGSSCRCRKPKEYHQHMSTQLDLHKKKVRKQQSHRFLLTWCSTMYGHLLLTAFKTSSS